MSCFFVESLAFSEKMSCFFVESLAFSEKMSCFFVESLAFSEKMSCFYNNPSGNPSHNLHDHNMNPHSCINLSITLNFLLPNTRVKLHIMATIHLTSSWYQATAKHVHTTMYLYVCKAGMFYSLTISGVNRFFWRLGRLITIDAQNRKNELSKITELVIW